MRKRMISLFSVLLFVTGAASAQITNGGFESGDFTGFSRSGFFVGEGGTLAPPTYAGYLSLQGSGTTATETNAVTSEQNSNFDGVTEPNTPIAPIEGDFLGFLSTATSAGDETLTGSQIAQTFTVPIDSLTLDVDIRLLTNTFSLFYAEYNDFGGVALLQGQAVLEQYVIDLSGNVQANTSVGAGGKAGAFLTSSAWETASFDVSSLTGGQVTLVAFVVNNGVNEFTGEQDNSAETRLLVDNIRFVGSAAQVAPEPGTLALLLPILGTGMGMMRRRK